MKQNLIAKGLLTAAVAGLVAGAMAPSSAHAEGKKKKKAPAAGEKMKCASAEKGCKTAEKGCKGDKGCKAMGAPEGTTDTTMAPAK